MSEIALKVENLTKEYRLGTIGYGTLREDLQSWFARIRGKDDPNSLITSRHNIESEKKHFLALQDINLEVNMGDRIGIIGKNGAGKSTLLKILSRITSPTKGNIKINGRIGSLLEVGTGFHQELTGRENIYLNGSILGMKKWEIDKKLDEIVDFAGVERFLDTPVKRYSSGMFVRLGFAVAAHLEPEILIVDEVLAVGDAEFQKKAIGKMEDVSTKEGRTILFVSHNMNSIKSLCNKFLWLEKGIEKAFTEDRNIVQEYLSNAIESNSSLIYIEDKNKGFQMIDCKILNQNNEETPFSCDDDVIIHINYISRFEIPGLYGCLVIRDDNGQIVMISDTHDDKKNSLENLKPGNGLLLISIPKRHLAPGIYSIELGFTSIYNDSGFIVDSPGIIASFLLEDSNTRRGNERKGYFSSILSWEKEEL